MADFAMWGPGQSPMRVQQEDTLNQLAMEKDRAQVTDLNAQAQLRQAEASKQSQQAQQAQAQQQAIQRLAMDKKITNLEEMGQGLISAGFPVAGGAMIKEFAQTMEQKALAEEHTAKAQENKLDQQTKLYDLLGRQIQLIDGSDDPQAAWQATKEKLKGAGVKLPSIIENSKWSPGLSERLAAAGMSEKDSIEARRKALNDASEAKRRESENRLDRAKEAEAYAKAATETVRRDNLKKIGANLDAGGKVKVVPRTPKEDVQTISELIQDRFPDVKVDEKGRLKDAGMAATASYLAGSAQKLLRDNKALSRDQALSQVFEGAVKDKVFEVTPGEKRFILPDKPAKTTARVPGAPKGPKTGEVVDGYKFKGGDPAQQSSWEKQ